MPRKKPPPSISEHRVPYIMFQYAEMDGPDGTPEGDAWAILGVRVMNHPRGDAEWRALDYQHRHVALVSVLTTWPDLYTVARRRAIWESLRRKPPPPPSSSYTVQVSKSGRITYTPNEPRRPTGRTGSPRVQLRKAIRAVVGADGLELYGKEKRPRSSAALVALLRALGEELPRRGQAKQEKKTKRKKKPR